MSLVITQRPTTTFQSKTVRHSMVGNPIVYKMTREDFATVTVADSAGNLRVTVVGDITTVLAIGDSVYFRSDNGVYDGYYEILTETYSAPDTTITFVGGYVSAGTTGFINLTTRLNFKAVIEVWGTSEMIGTLKVSPDSRGEVLVDVSRPLWAYMNPDISFILNADDEDQSTLYTEFYIKYQPVWIGGSESQTTDSTNYYAIYGANQVGYKYSGYLNEYISFSTKGTQSPKFLVTFPPRIWRTLPFNIATIFDYTFASNFNFEIQRLDVSGATISSAATTELDLRSKLVTCNPEALGTIPPTCTSINIRSDRAGLSGLSDYLNIPVEDPCYNPVLLRWLNTLGGPAYWCFDVNQEYSFEYDDGRKVKRMVLFADNLTLEEWEGLNELNTANEIYQSPFNELTTSVRKTSSTIGQQVVMHDYRNTELDVFQTGPSPANLYFQTSKPHGFSYADDDIVFISTSIGNGYFYASPYQPDGFLLRNLLTNALLAYTSTPTYAYARKYVKSKGVVVIPTAQTTNTKQEKHSINITIELPQVFTT